MWKKIVLSSFPLFFCGLHAAEDAASSQQCTEMSPHPFRVTMRHIEGKGVGYNQGYSTVEGFFTSPCCVDKKWVPFLDLRGHVFNDGNPAINTGLGVRYVGSRVWGGNAYYDYRKTNHFHYNQVAFGLESLGKLLDYRVNGYVPVGKKSTLYSARFEEFEGNSLILSSKKEFGMKGANAELGIHVTEYKYAALYAAAGPYYFGLDNVNAWGGEARLALDVTEYVRVEGNASYDSVFKGIVQGQLSLNIPFGGRKKADSSKSRSCAKQKTLMARALQRVDRSEIIVVDKKRHKSKAIDPATGEPYVFIFVNNTSHSNGTFESPYTTLAQAEAASSPGNVIYVDNGDGSSYTTGITLQDSQFLLSTAVPFSFNTTMGHVIVPASSGQMPTITTIIAATDVVNIANNNTISGFVISNTERHGISSVLNTTSGTLSGVTITSNTIEGNLSGDGMQLQSVGGTVVVDSNVVTGQLFAMSITTTSQPDAIYSITNNIVASSHEGFAVSLTDSSNVVTLIQGNTVATTSGDPVTYIQDNASVASGNTLMVQGNSLTGVSDCISTSLSDDAYLTSSITQNTLLSSTGNCINSLGFNNSHLTSTIMDNVMTSTIGIGISHEMVGSSLGTLVIDSNTITSNFAGVATETNSLANLTVTISNNTMNSTASDAIDCAAVNGSVFNLTLNDNTIGTASGNGVTLVAGSGAGDAPIANFTVSGNHITDFTNVGLSIGAHRNSLVTANITSNTFDFLNLTNSTFVLTDNAATACVTFQHNEINPPPSTWTDQSFQFTNTAGTLQLVTTGLNTNVGEISRTGAVTFIGSCP